MVKRMSKRKASTAAKAPPAKKRRMAGGQAAIVNPYMSKTIAYNDMHYTDFTDNTDATTTVVAVPVNTIAAGDTVLTRDGNKILMKAIEIKAVMSLEDVTVPQQVRCLLVYDEQPTNATQALSVVLNATTMLAFTDANQKSRYKILWDKVFTINPTIATAGALTKEYFKKYIKLKNLPAVYGSGGASVPTSGGLTFYYVGDTVAGTADLNFTVNCRLSYFG